MQLFEKRTANAPLLKTSFEQERKIGETVARFKGAKRIVVKVGTALVSNEGKLNFRFLWKLTGALSKLAKEGKQIVLVTSGAVSAGKKRIQPPEGKTLDETALKQLYAGFGNRLYDFYNALFALRGVTFTSHLLSPTRLSNQDIEHHNQFLENAFAGKGKTVFGKPKRPVILCYNADDVAVPNAELPHIERGERVFPDNAPMAKTVAMEIAKADALLYLTEVGGVHTAPPDEKNAKFVQIADEAMPRIKWGPPSKEGSGSMQSTHENASQAAKKGVATAIMPGDPKRLLDLLKGKKIRATYYPAQRRA